ncbi:hypothetical protein [Inhella proteolytica]|uniref:Peptidase M61 catalytic domain-containing protein n=1 Tax=Inhella proteolytica TaxID=2795029 RepID=A0A931J4E1_9BURK|nr:hypothetical protein [Inhella proteolytica]MBH9576097.1 hypothetical protein [Inhella proteolytica]
MWKCLGLLLAACGLVLPTQAASLTVTGSLDAQGRLLVRYEPPTGVRELPFWPPTPHGQEAWRQLMAEAGDACTELGPSALRIQPGCRAATLRVRPRVLGAYATYEPAQPQSDGSGVLLHTGHYAVLLPGTELRWRWVAPHVLQRGRAHRALVELRIPAAEVDQELQHSGWEQQKRIGIAEYVYLGRRAAERQGPAWLALDGGLGAARAAFVRERLLGTLQAYGQAYGRTLPHTGAVVVTLSESPGYHGDTTPGQMMRLRLPRDAATMSNEDFSHFIAHEVGHWWNKGLYSSDDAQPWLHEGHAEWMALVQQTQEGQMTPAQMRARVQGALNSCLAARGEMAMAALTGGRRDGTEYSCGLSLMQLAQALQTQRQPAAESPLRRLASLHAGSGHLDAARLVAWAEGDQPGALGRLLNDRGQPFGAGFTQALQALELADVRPVDRSEELDELTRRTQAAHWVRRTMNMDCGGAASYHGLRQGFKLETGPICKTLRLGQMAVALQGLPLMERPLEAWDAVQAACAQGDTIRVDYADGPSSELACSGEFPPRPLRVLVKLRPDALQRWGIPAG